ncbi:gamma-glutamyl hydrolase [Toxoplasma gondii MAS]|uniref:folate gamma-glutamyl hydrolase n=1 Tax=Toxoplasma gondii MAS TaxID=943118 RepID=A0A086QNL0_TOXGO|nr:gamma-glutamyl hydrolase [Toxoplasma gondii MAS]
MTAFSGFHLNPLNSRRWHVSKLPFCHHRVSRLPRCMESLFRMRLRVSLLCLTGMQFLILYTPTPYALLLSEATEGTPSLLREGEGRAGEQPKDLSGGEFDSVLSGDQTSRAERNLNIRAAGLSEEDAKRVCARAEDLPACVRQQIAEPVLGQIHRQRSAVIGVLAQGPVLPFVTGPREPFPHDAGRLPEDGGPSYIAASYAKFIEASGSKAVPVPAFASEEEYREVFDSLDGLILPGGEAAIDKASAAYYRATRLFLQWAKEANDAGRYFPVFGICLGFEAMMIWGSEGRFDYFSVDDYRNLDRARPLKLLPGALQSRLFGGPGFPSEKEAHPPAMASKSKYSRGDKDNSSLQDEGPAIIVDRTPRLDAAASEGKMERPTGNTQAPTRRLLFLQRGRNEREFLGARRGTFEGGRNLNSVSGGTFRVKLGGKSSIPSSFSSRESAKGADTTGKEPTRPTVEGLQRGERREAFVQNLVGQQAWATSRSAGRFSPLFGQESGTSGNVDFSTPRSGNSIIPVLPPDAAKSPREMYSSDVPLSAGERTTRDGIDDDDTLEEVTKPKSVAMLLQSQPASYFHHHRRMTRVEFERDPHLSRTFQLVATALVGDGTNRDESDEIVAIVEAKEYPFYGFQSHPEKPLFEHCPFAQVPHDMVSRLTSLYIAAFLGSEANKSNRPVERYEKEWRHLFERYPVYSTSSPDRAYLFEQVYIFPGTQAGLRDSEEKQEDEMGSVRMVATM